jgi:hypothetical protein
MLLQHRIRELVADILEDMRNFQFHLTRTNELGLLQLNAVLETHTLREASDEFTKHESLHKRAHCPPGA